MKKEFSNVHNIVIFSLFTTVALMLMIAFNAITKPILEAKRLSIQLETYETILKEIDYFIVLKSFKNFEVIQALDKDSAVMGIIYVTTSTNGYGDIKMISLVSTLGVVIDIKFLEYTQTAEFKPISEKNIEAYIGVHVSQLGITSDFRSGATQSLDSIKEAMSLISNYHQTLEFDIKSPFSEGVSGFYEVMEDPAFVKTNTVIQKSNILNISGDTIAYIYTLKKAGPYYEDSGDAEISIHVVLDLNQTILNIVIFDDAYKHSKGAFYARIKTYVSGYIGKTLQSNVLYVPDWNAGATSGNSKALIDSMLLDLVEVLR